MRVHLEPLPDALGLAPMPRVVTGHQAQLFHPGILAKYIAAAQAYGGSLPIVNVVVDQDAYDPLRLDLPRQEGDRLAVDTRPLAPVVPQVPIGCQPAADVARVRQALEAISPQTLPLRQALMDAFEAVGRPRTLAQQMAGVLAIAMRPWCAPSAAPREWITHTYASALLQDHAAEVVGELLRDADRAARLYNNAVVQHPGAGITPMRIEPDRVEVPMWRLRWMRPRERVFVDRADSKPIFTTEAGELIDNHGELAPRALLMTALMRRPTNSDLFIHGTGGWVYDLITERWWAAWRGEALAPMACVTADAYLDFQTPVNDQAALSRAVWHRHHLKHNVDRYAATDHPEADYPLVERKRDLLAHMDDDRDRARRRAAFDELHRINAELCDACPQVIRGAEAALDRTRAGLANRAIATRRDWFFGLYPAATLDRLCAAIVTAATPSA